MVNDMIIGARTIKSYGWENHYISKIKGARNKQLRYVFGQGLIGFLVVSFFQNGGLVAAMAIVIPKWARGEKLDEGISISLLAMVFYIFLSVNSFTYYGMTTLQQFLAIISRYSSVFEMGEFEFKRETDVPRERV